MTLADCIEAVLLEQGPLPVCTIAPAVRKQKAEVIRTLTGNPDRFVHNGRKARASRWGVRRDVSNAANEPSTYVVDELATRWGDDLAMGRLFVRDFLRAGYLESVNGNGRVRVTELGQRVSHSLNWARP